MNARTEDTNLEQPEGEAPDPAAAIEAEARREGWRPQADWNGPEDQWIDAETFVKRGREINPLLRKHNKALKAEVDSVKAQLVELKATADGLRDYNAKIEEQAYKRAMKEIRKEKADAIKDGDTDRVVELEEEMEELQSKAPKAKAEEPPPAKPAVDPVFAAWMEENSTWFNDDNPDVMDFAEIAGRRLRREDATLRGRPFLDAVKKAVKKEYPDLFGGRREAPGMVEGAEGNRRGPGPAMPAEVRREMSALCEEPWYKDEAKRRGFKTPQAMFEHDFRN